MTVLNTNGEHMQIEPSRGLTYAVKYAIFSLRGKIMKCISITQARKNIYKLVEEVNQNHEPITVTNTKGNNAILISEEDWNSICETLYLESIPGMTEKIIEGINTPLEDCVDGDEVNW